MSNNTLNAALRRLGYSNQEVSVSGFRTTVSTLLNEMGRWNPDAYSFINTCFATHHLQFGYDANDTLWLSGTGPVAGWINTKMFGETGDAAKSQGWSPFVLDTKGNGRRDDYVEPNVPLDPNKDKRIVPGSRPDAVMPSPVDGSIWYTVGIFGGPPGGLRFDPGSSPTSGHSRRNTMLRTHWYSAWRRCRFR